MKDRVSHNIFGMKNVMPNVATVMVSHNIYESEKQKYNT